MIRILRCLLIVSALALGTSAGGFRPADALARQSMSFSPGDRVRHSAARASRHGWARHARRNGRAAHAAPAEPHVPTHVVRGAGGEGDDGPAAKAVPDKGFTMENGVLTYPAPARFQPQNLRHH